MDQEITTPRNVQWVGDSRERLQTFPESVRKDIGHALYRVQIGETPPLAKPMRSIESGVFEIIDNYDTDTYRAVYTVKIGQSFYILHCFQKKSKRGISALKKEIDLIKRRLRRAKEIKRKL
ncbi:MAG: type II toxin-antitoxin system RelE/ParE family toxin [Candidatus Poribacteria bacterium]|nr:type II toxin-antitoxin system RelE/ParE family toxin [Candidatus Poribacteria bacterium]